ncbi:1008_t:CDS:2 [Racocetra fulgida]|uniref:tRNA(Phe) 7-[(3-amino-3-carboxypropyl)-4-demethylwyosine(37)-N(4)]-methyltransferase n=1 Tax=Racocetra fulgida TaxID=60492 RepID=A0A9N8WAU0_9GLOM|nr:1008_t:CDS:2 [Racocetra fulgida]
MSAQLLPQTASRRLPTTYHSVQPGFHARKQQILASLTDQTSTRTDNNANKYSSSKISSPLIDEAIFPIIELINKHEDYVVTSSCSGKISIISTNASSNKCRNSRKSFSGKLESLTTGSTNHGETENGVVYRHQDDLDDIDDPDLNSGGGSGGKLLFVAHSKINLPKEKDLINNFLLKLIFGEDFENVTLFNNESYNLLQNNDYNLIYFKFDPMILHAEARTLDAAKNLVNLAVDIGYRDSGLLITSKRHMIGLRKSGTLSDGNDGDVSTVDDESQGLDNLDNV